MANRKKKKKKMKAAPSASPSVLQKKESEVNAAAPEYENQAPEMNTITPQKLRDFEAQQPDGQEASTSEPTAEIAAVQPAAVPPAPRKRRARRPRLRLNYVRRLTLLVCTALLIFSGYHIIEEKAEEFKGDSMYADLEQSFISFPSPEQTSTPESSPTPTPENLHDLPGVSMDIPESPQISYVEDYAPDIWPSVDFEGLRGVNADTEAWILCVGTNINYPVVHSHDNEDYLTKMFDGRTSKLGAIFVDKRNSWGFTDKNTVVYGHNLRNHSMFWTLTEYRFQSFYDEHPTLRLILPDGKYEIQVFAAVVAEADEISFWDMWWATDEDHAAWLDMVKRNSKIRTTPEVTTEDRIVTLSTCTYEYTDARCLVYGKLVAVE